MCCMYAASRKRSLHHPPFFTPPSFLCVYAAGSLARAHQSTTSICSCFLLPALLPLQHYRCLHTNRMPYTHSFFAKGTAAGRPNP
jgi:hypothetical protein